MPDIETQLRQYADAVADRLIDEQRPDRPDPGRRSMIRPGLIAATVVLVLGAVFAVTRPFDEPSEVRTTLEPSGEGAPEETAEPSTPASPAGPVKTYDLTLSGAELVGEEVLAARDTDAALWQRTDRSAYLSLVSRPGLAEAAGLPGGTVSASLPADQGSAVFEAVEDSDHPALGMWWSRADGDLWILSSHWDPSDNREEADRQAELQAWALAIDSTGGSETTPGFELSDPTMRLIAAQVGGDVESRSRVWELDGEELLLLSIQGAPASGLSNLLSVAGWPEPYQVAGTDGWLVTRADGSTVVAWIADASTGTWTTLSIRAGLAGRTDDITTALREHVPDR